MPWKELAVVSLRAEFARRALKEQCSFTALCAEYRISPKTGYKWKQRFERAGEAGMKDQSRRPEHHPQELGEGVVCEIVRLKTAHRHWGPRKIRDLYRQLHGESELPSDSTFQRVLDRAGLVERRPQRRASEAGRLQSRLVAKAPNELWTVDFKGWWYTPGGKRCEPLTVRDAFSRFVLAISLPLDARTETIRCEFERLFARYGLPGTIRSDNGSPFAMSRAPLGLSRLSAWWLALGIDLDRTDPGHPEQNGAHERLHRDMACEVEGCLEGDLAEHAAALEVWRRSYNEERPHEALGMRRPAELYQCSPRTFTGTPERLSYGPEYLDRQVTCNGEVWIEGVQVPITASLAGWNVGLRPTEAKRYAVHFARICLGQIDLSTRCFYVCPPAAVETGALPQAPGFSASGTNDTKRAEAKELQP